MLSEEFTRESDAKVSRQEEWSFTKGFIGPEFPTLVEIEREWGKISGRYKRRTENRIFPGSEI